MGQVYLHFLGKHSDRVQWTKQGAVFGAALRFLQAPAAARRKNRLSARGKRGGRVQWTNFDLYPPAAHSGVPLSLRDIPLRGIERATAPPRCRLLTAAKHQLNHSGTAAGRTSSERPGAPVWGRGPQAGGKHTEALPAADAARRAWRSAPIFTRALCGPQGKLAKRKRF